MHRRRLVRVPASSANLGPGFDVLAAALALHVELEVEETGRFAVHTDLQIARDRRNLAVRAFETLHPADGFEFTIRSDVPLSGGLGTSAAAYVAGLMAADSLFELDVQRERRGEHVEARPEVGRGGRHPDEPAPMHRWRARPLRSRARTARPSRRARARSAGP